MEGLVADGKLLDPFDTAAHFQSRALIFEEATILNGAFNIEPERLQHERGWFDRVWDQRELQARGLNFPA